MCIRDRVKGADEVLAVLGIDRGLAADGGIDLRQQRGRDLHIVEPAAHHCRRKSGEVADHPAAERHHQVGALDARGDEGLAHPLQDGEALRALARRHGHHGGADPGLRQRRLCSGEMVVRDGLVADDGDLGARSQRRDPLAERSEDTAADHDVVAALAERDIDQDRIA